MKVTVNSTNSKGIKGILSRLKKGTVEVGILAGEGKHEDSTLSVAEIGFYHEFGTVSTPERSFIRSTLENKSTDIKKVARDQYKKVIDGDITIKQGLGILGAFTSAEIQKTFKSNDWKPNTISTQVQKGSATPLIDTGQLRQSISFEVKS